MSKAFPTLNHSMILHILDIFFSKGMEEKSPSAAHQSLQFPVPCCGSERQASLCMDMISCSCRNLPSDFHLYLKNVEETIVLKQKAEKSSAKIYFA